LYWFVDSPAVIIIRVYVAVRPRLASPVVLNDRKSAGWQHPPADLGAAATADLTRVAIERGAVVTEVAEEDR
jgi:hypothetical protein